MYVCVGGGGGAGVGGGRGRVYIAARPHSIFTLRERLKVSLRILQ